MRGMTQMPGCRAYPCEQQDGPSQPQTPSSAQPLADLPPSWRFSALSKRGSDVTLIVRNAGQVVQFFVGSRCRASTSRDKLAQWLRTEGVKLPYGDGKLTLANHALGVSLSVDGFIQPTVLTRSSLDQFVAVVL